MANPGIKMWAVKRDAYIYAIYPQHRRARHECAALCLEGHSKHIWSVVPVRVVLDEKVYRR